MDARSSRIWMRYEGGVALDPDLAANRWVLHEAGARYDGFTPFNCRGYMAVLEQGRFEVTWPGIHAVEISPHQPSRDELELSVIHAGGRTIVRGRFGDRKWRLPTLRTWADAGETNKHTDVDPVLALRLAS